MSSWERRNVLARPIPRVSRLSSFERRPGHQTDLHHALGTPRQFAAPLEHGVADSRINVHEVSNRRFDGPVNIFRFETIPHETQHGSRNEVRQLPGTSP